MSAQKANNTIDKVQQLQRDLYRAAKKNSKRKFHALYDKVYRKDILEAAWRRVKANKGCGGIDGISLADVEAYGVERLLAEMETELRTGKYRPQPVRRVFIPKSDGRLRPLGIPVIKDRIVQMAAKLVLEPIWEADFMETSYGFRPKRSARQALEVVRNACRNRGWWVMEVDIQSYFDNINHEKLMLMAGMRISDRRVLKLIRQWLKAGVMTKDGYEETPCGSPQGGVISPVLANLYLHYLDVKWAREGSYLGKMVRYADDLVAVCRTRKDAEHALAFVNRVMGRLDLTLHPGKTKLVSMWNGQEGFDFLGMHHRYMRMETQTGQWIYGFYQYPTKKAMNKMRERMRDELGNRSQLAKNAGDLVKAINPIISGWRNYYGLWTASKWLGQVDSYILRLFTIWYNKKRQKRRHLVEMDSVNRILQACKLYKLAG